MAGLSTGAIIGIAAGSQFLGAGISALMGGPGKRKAERQEKAARARRQVAEANRQDVPDFQQDMLNPAANLQVATQANIMQAEQADISLASSLDTLRATGASAGGATALARAAAQSKRGVAASIEKQEMKNAELRAQGELQAAQIRQKGQVYAFQAQEAREMTELDRQSSLESSYNQQAAAYKAQTAASVGQAVGAIGTSFVGMAQAGMFKGDRPTNLTGVSKITPQTNLQGGGPIGIEGIRNVVPSAPTPGLTPGPIAQPPQMAGVGSLLPIPMPIIGEPRVDPVTGKIIY
jgi:hypothetical protein